MTYEDNKEYASKGVAGAGLGLGIAGTAIALLASHNGFLGIGGNSSVLAEKDAEIALLKANSQTDAKILDSWKASREADKLHDKELAELNSRVLALETSAPLREQIVMGQIQNVATSVATNTAALQGQICQINKTLSGITALYVPASVVTPEPMPLKNSWTAPTSTTTGA